MSKIQELPLCIKQEVTLVQLLGQQQLCIMCRKMPQNRGICKTQEKQVATKEEQCTQRDY